MLKSRASFSAGIHVHSKYLETGKLGEYEYTADSRSLIIIVGYLSKVDFVSQQSPFPFLLTNTA